MFSTFAKDMNNNGSRSCLTNVSLNFSTSSPGAQSLNTHTIIQYNSWYGHLFVAVSNKLELFHGCFEVPHTTNGHRVGMCILSCHSCSSSSPSGVMGAFPLSVSTATHCPMRTSTMGSRARTIGAIWTTSNYYCNFSTSSTCLPLATLICIA